MIQEELVQIVINTLDEIDALHSQDRKAFLEKLTENLKPTLTSVYLKGGLTVRVSSEYIGDFLHDNQDVTEHRYKKTRRPSTDYEEISK